MPNHLAQRVRSLELHKRVSETGKWSKKNSCISMKPLQIDPKIYRTVRLQNTAGSSTWEPQISTVMGLIAPAFEKFQLVSFTVHGPTVAGMPTVSQFEGGAEFTTSFFNPREGGRPSPWMLTRSVSSLPPGEAIFPPSLSLEVKQTMLTF